MRRGDPDGRNYAYIVECADGTLYTGWTNDLKKRMAAHNAGNGAKYTRSRRPVTLVCCRAFETRSEAMAEEARIKRLTRKQKQELIEAASRGSGAAAEADDVRKRHNINSPKREASK